MTIVTAHAVKESNESKVGIAFSRSNVDSPLIIKLIREGGLFDNSELRPGMTIVSIMGQEMTWKTPKEAASLLRAVPGGQEISIVTRVMMGKYTKASKDEVLGISLKNSTAKPGIFISRIAEDSKFKGSELKVGQRVLFIDGKECPETTKAAINLVKDCEGELIIIATETDLVCPEDQRIEIEEAPTVKSLATSTVASSSVKETDVVAEEKKEDTPSPEEVKPAAAAPAAEADAPDVEYLEEEGEPGKNGKGLLDSMFAACIC